MNRFNQILIVALAVQLVLAGGIYFGGKPMATGQIRTALLDTDPAQVNRISIVGEDGKQAVLSKTDDRWQLPEYHQLPANESKVQQALDALASSNRGWPVATTDSGRERFKVLDDKFDKKIILEGAEESPQTLYLGTSPGYRQVHTRLAGEDEVYAVKLNGYDLAPQSDAWLDKTLLQPDGEITSLKGPDFELQKTDGAWKSSAGVGEVDSEELAKVTGTLARLRVSAVANEPAANVDYELTLKSADNTLTYLFFKADENHYVTRDDYTQSFEINQADYEKIVKQTATRLIQEIGDGSETSAASVRDDTKILDTSKTSEEVMRNEDG